MEDIGIIQIKLSENSQILTTFNVGKYRYLRLPFGLCSAPEVFHRTFENIFHDIPGIEVYIDDLVVWGENEKQHADRLNRMCKRKNVKFFKNKCKFGLSEVKYVGHIISKECIKPDSDKVKGILEMEVPKVKNNYNQCQIL